MQLSMKLTTETVSILQNLQRKFDNSLKCVTEAAMVRMETEFQSH